MNRAIKGFTIGAHVVVAESSPWNEPGIGNRIYEVTGARLANGSYVYSVAPVTSRGTDRTRALELVDSDLRGVDSERRTKAVSLCTAAERISDRVIAAAKASRS